MTTEYAKGDRVSYTVMYDLRPRTRYVTEYGHVTRVQPGGARNEPQATIAVENPQPGRAKYVTRYVATIAPAPLDADAKTEYHYLYRNAHEHKSPDGAQTLRHSHEGGNAAHSYYGHPEDGPRWPGMAGKRGDDMTVCPGPCPSHDPYTAHPEELGTEPQLAAEGDHVHCGLAGHTDPGEEELPQGWQVFYDGELVFGADADKWEDIGPTVTTIMTATDGTPELTYTRDQVTTAINAAADLTGELMNPDGYESSDSIRSDDAMNMVVNLAGTLLDKPDATVEDVILDNWGSESEDFENAGVEEAPTDEDGHPRDHTEAEQRAVDEAQIERIRGWFE